MLRWCPMPLAHSCCGLQPIGPSKMLHCCLWMLALCVILIHAGTNKEGLAFLEANKGKEGVVTLPSGLQYKVLKGGGWHGASHGRFPVRVPLQRHIDRWHTV